jgi:hypothetical protein
MARSAMEAVDRLAGLQALLESWRNGGRCSGALIGSQEPSEDQRERDDSLCLHDEIIARLEGNFLMWIKDLALRISPLVSDSRAEIRGG